MRLILYVAAAAALAGCSSASGSSGYGPAALDAGTRGTLQATLLAPSASVHPGIAHPDMRPSWISSELSSGRRQPLLFVTDEGTGQLFIFRLSTLKLVGMINTMSIVQGECADNAGDVWVAANHQIVEYSHSAQLKNTLTDPDGYAMGCAWDSTTGDLAVANVVDVVNGQNKPGSVWIYPPAGGTPTEYKNRDQISNYFMGYDPDGNLFVDGRNAINGFMLSELLKGATKMQTIHIAGGRIYFPGMVQWDPAKNDLAVGDQICRNKTLSCLYSVSVSGSNGSIVGKTGLNNYQGEKKVCDLIQGELYEGRLVGSDNEYCGYTASAQYVWPFPNGGNPTVFNDSVVTSEPIGAVVSK